MKQNMHFNFIPPFLLLVIGFTSMVVMALDSRAGKGMPNPFSFAAALYAAVCGLTLMFVSEEIKVMWAQVMVGLFLPWMVTIYWLKSVIIDQIRINEEFEARKNSQRTS